MLRAVRELLISCSFVLVAATACDADQTKGATPTKTQTGAKTPPKPALDEPPPADMIMEAPGVDVSKLSGAKRDSFFRAINTEQSACGKPHSLAKSLVEDGECRDSMHVAQFIADRLAGGATPGDIKLDIDAVSAALTQREIPVEGRPVFGNERAPVTIVVFADFQCPMCKQEAPELREAIEHHGGRAKLVFKHFPLTEHHDRAEAAAIAAEAAHLQGKFWAMHDRLFANQDALSDEDLERYAAQIDGLDVAKWKADMASDAVKLAVAGDRGDGEKLDLPGTPTVYVDGREVVPMLWGGQLDAYIEDALRR